MKEKLSFRQLVWIGIGHVIGAGIVSIIGSGIAATGYSVWMAFALTCLLSLIQILPVMFFTSAVTVPGGKYGMITSCAGRQYGGLIAISSMLSWCARATAVLALSRYISEFLPFVNAKAAAVGLWAFFCAANLFGVNVMSKIQNAASPLLLAALITFAAACCFNLQGDYLDFSSPNMFTGGTRGFFTAVMLLSYSCDGIGSLANYAPMAENPKKTIPLAIFTVWLVTGCVYVFVGFGAGGVLPPGENSSSTLLATARQVFPPLLYNLFVIFGPIFALVTAMNSGILDSALPVMAAAEDGWLPSFLAVKNKLGAYRNAILIIFIIGALPTLLDFSVSGIASMTMALSALSGVLFIVAGVKFIYIHRKSWEKSFLHIPDRAYMTVVFLSAVIELFVVIKALMQLSFGMIVLNLFLTCLCAVYGVKKYRRVLNLSAKRRVKAKSVSALTSQPVTKAEF